MVEPQERLVIDQVRQLRHRGSPGKRPFQAGLAPPVELCVHKAPNLRRLGVAARVGARQAGGQGCAVMYAALTQEVREQPLGQA